jgi:hypothetical protein
LPPLQTSQDGQGVALEGDGIRKARK